MLADRIRMCASRKKTLLPGNQELIAGDLNAGFYGEVPADEFITGDTLASMINLSAGVAQFSNEPWLKFAYQEKILFIAKKPFRYGISWMDINSANAVYGEKTVTIGGLKYKVRLIKGANSDPTFDIGGGEWNALIYGVHDTQQPNWANYTDADLITHYNNGSGAATWCQETSIHNSEQRIYRGYLGVTIINRRGVNDSWTAGGWRPVLEFVE